MRYLLYDVFTDTPLEGNPLAIFPEPGELDTRTMQKIAQELNLAESVFVHRGDDSIAATLRIFTPAREMAFAGHPTIGTSIALIDALGWLPAQTTTFTLRLNVGDVPIRIDRDGAATMAWLQTPTISVGTTIDATDAARCLGLPVDAIHPDFVPGILGAGTPFLFIALRDSIAVDAAVLDEAALRAAIDVRALIGVFFFAPVPTGAYSRMCAPMSGIIEDPATGSASGPLGAYLVRHGAIPARDGLLFVSEQGVKMGRRSLIHGSLRVRDGALQTVEIGGNAVAIGHGDLQL